jgi:cytoskeletal protein RodZ
MYHQLTDNHATQALIHTLTGVANPAGGSAGASVSVPVTVTDRFGNGRLPSSLHYNVSVTPSQPCFVTVTNKSLNGFSVVLTPKDASTTLAAGTFDVSVLA